MKIEQGRREGTRTFSIRSEQTTGHHVALIDLVGAEKNIPQELSSLGNSSVYVLPPRHQADATTYTAVVNYPLYGEQFRALLSASAPLPGMEREGILDDWSLPDRNTAYHNGLKIIHAGLPMEDFEPHRRPFMRAMELSPEEMYHKARECISFTTFWEDRGVYQFEQTVEQIMKYVANPTYYERYVKTHLSQIRALPEGVLQKLHALQSGYEAVKENDAYRYPKGRDDRQRFRRAGNMMERLLTPLSKEERRSLYEMVSTNSESNYTGAKRRVVFPDDPVGMPFRINDTPAQQGKNGEIIIHFADDVIVTAKPGPYGSYEPSDCQTSRILYPTIQWQETKKGDRTLLHTALTPQETAIAKRNTQKSTGDFPPAPYQYNTLAGQFVLTALYPEARYKWPQVRSARGKENYMREGQIVLFPLEDGFRQGIVAGSQPFFERVKTVASPR